MSDWKKINELVEQLIYELGINNKIIGVDLVNLNQKLSTNSIMGTGIRTVQIELKAILSDELSKVDSLSDVVYSLNRQDK